MVLGSTKDKDCRNCKKRKRTHVTAADDASNTTKPVIKKVAIKCELRKREMRSSKGATEALEAGVGDLISSVLGDAALLSVYAGRKTLKLRDLEFAAKLSQRK